MSLINQSNNRVDFPTDFIVFFKFNNGQLCINSIKPKGVNSIGLGYKTNNEVYVFDGTLGAAEIKQEIKECK